MNLNKVLNKNFPEIKILNFFEKDFDFFNLQGIHIWKINISDLEDQLDYFESFLCFDENQKASRFKFKDDQNRCIISRACLRILCGKYLSKIPKSIEFAYKEKGKPYIREADFSFNVSHSKDIVLIGFSKFENLGIDVEYNRDMNDFMSIAKNYFHEKECEILESVPKTLRKCFFLRYWTVKEAYVKALGEGLGKSANSFYADGDLCGKKFLNIIDAGSLDKNFFVHSFLPQDNYFGAVCFRSATK